VVSLAGGSEDEQLLHQEHVYMLIYTDTISYWAGKQNKYHTQPDLHHAILTLLIGWHDNDYTLLPSAHCNCQLFDTII
jgi:hypothetical protein